jgi:hypothetical protein
MIPLSLIIIALVLLAVITYWAITFIIIYHLTRFGIGTQPKILASIFFFGSAFLSVVSIFLFFNIDVSVLKDSLELLQSMSFLNI